MEEVKKFVQEIYNAAEYDDERQEIIDIMSKIVKTTLYASLFSGLDKK